MELECVYGKQGKLDHIIFIVESSPYLIYFFLPERPARRAPSSTHRPATALGPATARRVGRHGMPAWASSNRSHSRRRELMEKPREPLLRNLSSENPSYLRSGRFRLEKILFLRSFRSVQEPSITKSA